VGSENWVWKKNIRPLFSSEWTPMYRHRILIITPVWEIDIKL
jgi:hypothetical protein